MERLFDFTVKHKDSKLSKENIVRSAKDHDEKCERCGGTPLKGELCYTTDEYYALGTHARCCTHRVCEKCMTELLAEKHGEGRGFNVYISPTHPLVTIQAESGRVCTDTPIVKQEWTPIKQEWTPKRGERVLVSDDIDFSCKVERIYVSSEYGMMSPHLCVRCEDESKFEDGDDDTFFGVVTWKYMKPLPKEDWKPVCGERVLVNDYSESTCTAERIFITTVQGQDRAYMCVGGGDEHLFDKGKSFSVATWKYMKPIPVKTKFDIAQEQAMVVKEMLGTLDSCLKSNGKLSSRGCLANIAYAVQKIVVTLKE